VKETVMLSILLGATITAALIGMWNLCRKDQP
jgi:hypothetical protein